MYRGWTQTDYQNKHYNINQKDEGTLDDRGSDGGTNLILRIKEQETRLTLQEHDDDDDDDDGLKCVSVVNIVKRPNTRKQYYDWRGREVGITMKLTRNDTGLLQHTSHHELENMDHYAV